MTADTACAVTVWCDSNDQWHATCSTHGWASTDGNFNRGEVKYLAEVHSSWVEKARAHKGSSDGGDNL
jgi:hypothetical protein